MGESKVRRVRLDVEPKYITEDSENRIYMSVLSVEEKTEIKIYKRSKTSKYREKAPKEIICWWIARIALSIGLFALIMAWTLSVCFRVRGYWAIGSEWMFLALAGGGIYWCVGRFLEY